MSKKSTKRLGLAPSFALAWAALLIVSSFADSARADLPPPDGKKFVDYELVVENVDAFADYVLFIYPWSATYRAPTYELHVVESGKTIRFERHSPSPKLYLMKKTDFDKWRSEQGTKVNEAAAQLLQSSSVVACDLAPSPVHVLPTSDSRSVVTEKLKLTGASATQCSIESLSAATSAPQASNSPSSSSPPAASTAPTAGPSAKPQSSNANDSSPDAKSSSAGCMGCAIEERTKAGVAGLCGAIGALAIFAKRRARRKRS